MDKLLVFLILMPFTLMLLFQPFLDRLEEAREKTVQVAIQRGTEKAAVEGFYSSQNIEDMYALLKKVGYSEDDIEFEGTYFPVERGQYVEGSLKVPNVYQFLLFENLVSGEYTEKFHFHSATRMSEYIE